MSCDVFEPDAPWPLTATFFVGTSFCCWALLPAVSQRRRDAATSHPSATTGITRSWIQQFVLLQPSFFYWKQLLILLPSCSVFAGSSYCFCFHHVLFFLEQSAQDFCYHRLFARPPSSLMLQPVICSAGEDGLLFLRLAHMSLTWMQQGAMKKLGAGGDIDRWPTATRASGSGDWRQGRPAAATGGEGSDRRAHQVVLRDGVPMEVFFLKDQGA